MCVKPGRLTAKQRFERPRPRNSPFNSPAHRWSCRSAAELPPLPALLTCFVRPRPASCTFVLHPMSCAGVCRGPIQTIDHPSMVETHSPKSSVSGGIGIHCTANSLRASLKLPGFRRSTAPNSPPRHPNNPYPPSARRTASQNAAIRSGSFTPRSRSTPLATSTA